MSRTVEVALDDHGGIIIPAAVRESLDLSPGMTLVVEEAEDASPRLRVQPEAAGPELVEKEGVWVIRAEALRDLTDVVNEEREQRIQDLVRQAGL